jgi:hypothetical protein
MPSIRSILVPSLCLAALLPGQRAVETEAALPEGAPASMTKIDIEGLRTHAFKFASDEFGGRYTGTAGQIAAAEYVATRLEELGFEPLGDRQGETGRSYFQSYPVRKTYLDEDKTGLRLGGEDHADGFGVLASRAGDGEIDVDGQLVYLGYGARGELPEQLGEGEIPLVLLRTRSRAGMRTEAQFMMGLGAFGKARQIASRLANAGAPCVLFGVLHDDSGTGEMLNYAGLLPGKPLLQFGNDAGMAGMVAGMRVDVPMLFLSRARTLEALASTGHAVGDEDEIVAADGADAADSAARVRVAVATDADARALNVCAVLRGSDEALREEAVVFSAHMDHMGTRVDGDVFNGADDNASGSAAFLEVAEAFAAGERPRRSVIFLSVSGEELGLWGSKHYAENPTWDLESLVANVNIDMIGRVAELSGANEISITPSYRHPKFSSIARGAAALADRFGMGLTNGDQFYERSDHYNFAVRGVPVVFFCDGEHEDYHQVSDTADKLDYEKIQKVARLAFWIGHEVANDDERPREIGRQPSWQEDGEAAAGSEGSRRGR